VTKVGTTKNLPKLQRVMSLNVLLTGLSFMPTWPKSYILMNEHKCRAPIHVLHHSASHVSSSNTAQIGCDTSANTRISEL